MKTNTVLIVGFLIATNVFSNKIQAINKVESEIVSNSSFIIELPISVSDTSSEYSNKTIDELKVLLQKAIEEEDYEVAEKIQNILDTRPKHVAKKPKATAPVQKKNEIVDKTTSHIESGKLFIGGSFGFSTSSRKNKNTTNNITTYTDDYSIFRFNFLPQIGFMVSNSFGVGVGMGYDYVKTTTYDDINAGILSWNNVEKEGIFEFTPFARYYKKTGANAYLFGEFEMGIGMGSYKFKQLNSTATGIEDGDPVSIFKFSTQLSIGFNYFLNEKCAIEAKWGALNYNSRSYTQEGTLVTNRYYNKNTYKDFNFGFDLSTINIGLKIFL